MQRLNTVILVVFLSVSALFSTACNPATAGGSDLAATVNGKPIKREEVEKVLKNRLRDEMGKLSPLELAQARLQGLEQLIQQEVLFQKAEKEKTVPTEEEVTQEINKQKTTSGKSQEEFDKALKDAGITEADLRENVKKQLAIDKLVEKVTGAVEPPKDKEIEDFFNSSKDLYVNKRGAQFAAVVLDPTDSGQPTDRTKNQTDLGVVLKEINQKLGQGVDFATVAREYSEDPASAARGGDFQFFTIEQMDKLFGQNGAGEAVVSKFQVGAIVPQLVQLEGKTLILKLQRKQEKDEAQDLTKPEVRQNITDGLINARKSLLSASFAAVAMNESRIENFLAKEIVARPNELSGARPASAANSNTGTENANVGANTNSAANTAANAANKPAANTAANANKAANTAANTANANK